ncbi:MULTISPECIES: hypothetical protein [unclassified Janthinobacterium]|uniref:hypothetical protein n=1 Tax=unclassified Janthinobacterium TaxID=2610881 RepID=UPI001608780C|nr:MULTISPECIES: hypothetical protein [unclassified Janthinobacterium]MBB5368300.1 hypothetical protein [Janthinobacterium sp. K2C7]MBB5382164.1 hypothetical protein [Janthinobacterium sp. K2Li3]MBB5386682.1 hypothetical protein [Janthinobacterium sp. K2E3]
MTINEQTATSPSASGPAGAFFEGQVAAHYLLTMLAEADPRGLPGVLIGSVELQRAGEGHPLDDVIVRGVTHMGEPAVLEVQVKRTITFSPNDAVFKSVVEQLAQALQKLDFTHQRHQFAVATERTSFKITGPYQDVLRWAREVGSESVFHGRIKRKKVGNDDMRSFVETVRSHLLSAGCMGDDETVWQVLRRFQILTFDFDAPGSHSIELALERARNFLDPIDSARAGVFWKILTETSIRAAASGGDFERSKLLSEVSGIDGFRLRGSPRNRASRETLAEAAGLAAADLRRSIAGIVLARSTQLNAVREARDQGRYIEIRGAPGVGKSGLLGTLVEQVSTEGRVIVLTPERTTPGGWPAFKAEFQIDGGIASFLSDLACDGGATLFVDSLDFFDDPGKRATVTDLVRAAAIIPAFQVIVTVRTDFDKDEPNWLPSDILAKLGHARPVIIDDLGAEEIEELKAAAPTLSALLSDMHPANAVARNLFRLSRLLEVDGRTDQLRSEIDLLERWWTTADGPQVNRRERKRLLANLSDAILAGRDYLEATAEALVVDALVSSRTLRELSLDQLSFHHDVLREWGVASRLHDSPDRIDQLPLDRAVPVSLARGIELGARFALERSEDGEPWREYLNRVSRDGAHASWRRWALLAILRSELALTLLDRASAYLMENDGVLLRELIRTALAVESRPLVEMLAEYVEDAEKIPATLYGPINGSWTKLTDWLLIRRSHLPLCVLPDVVELFRSLSTAIFWMGPMTPKMAIVLADWLEEIEDAKNHHLLASDKPRFAKAFRSYDLQKLETDVRQAFLLMAARVPERAQCYLRSVLGRRNSDYIIREILKFRGTLAVAAPVELVEITLAGLIPKQEHTRTPQPEAFTHLDNDFLPSSPAQGPFLELLNVAPEHGLSLIRRLLDHAIIALPDIGEPGTDGFTLVFPTGPRYFPCEQSYLWSRQAGDGYAVESALLALEAWTHTRIEKNEEPAQIISDVLGPEGSPAAFLMVAVDILISHWPKSMAIAIPFLGSPELLTADRTRQFLEVTPEIDFGEWGAIGPKEPTASIMLADLKSRPSRRWALEALLSNFAINESVDRSLLHGLLIAASERLGPVKPNDTFATPRFMAHHALNVINPMNWQAINGSLAYVSPTEEVRHIETLQKKNSARARDSGIDAAIQNAVEDGSKSSSELVEQALAYAQRLETMSDMPEDIPLSRASAIASTAMILTRDGSDVMLSKHEEWARDVFARMFSRADGISVSRTRHGMRFNPVAIAALGLIHLWRRHGRQEDRNLLLELAGRDDPHAAHGFGAALAVIYEIDPRFVPALLRCALVAQVQPMHEDDDFGDTKKANQVRHRQHVAAAIQAEVAWLNNTASEPIWPPLPSRRPSVRQSLGSSENAPTIQPVRVAEPSGQLHSQNAALWLRQLTLSSEIVDPAWSVSFVNAYADWTAEANGVGLAPDTNIDNRPGEWNSIFFSIMGRSFTRMSPDETVTHILRVSAVPEDSFFDIVTRLVPAIDQAYFSDLGLDVGIALKLRVLLADRLIDTAGWRREQDRSEMNIETRVGAAIAVFFFNNYSPFSDASCYLFERGIGKIAPFFPELGRLIGMGPVTFSALLTMNLLEVSPRSTHLEFFLSSALVWLQRQPANKQLWVDNGLGSRMVAWLEGVLQIDTVPQSASYPLRPQIDDVLARLVQIGVAQAHALEVLIATKTSRAK